MNTKGWKTLRIEELTNKIGSGTTPTGGETVYLREGAPFIRSQNVGWGILLLNDLYYLPDHIHNKMSSTILKKNDVLLNITGASIGRSAIVDERIEGGNVNQHVCILRPKTDIINPIFLNQFIISDRGQKLIDSYQSGGNRQGLNFEQIKTFEVPVPPLEEQLKITKILKTSDAAIEKLKQLINAKEKCKKALMQKLLTGKIRFKEFKEVKWKNYLLEEVSDIQKGEQLGKLEMIEDGKYYVLNGGIGESGKTDKWNVNENTITISEGGNSCGYVNFNTEKFWCGGHCYALKNIKSNCDLGLLYQVLKFNETNIMKLRVGSGLPNIQKSALQKFSIYISESIKEQRSIAAVLINFDNEIQNLKSQLAQLKLQKRGLMQLLLTGKVRVKI